MQPGIILLREGTDTSQVRHDLGGGGGAPPRDERWHFGPRTKEKNRNCGRGAEVRSRFSWGGMPRAISFGAVGSLLLPPLLTHVYAVARATWWGQLVPVLPVPIFSPSALALGPVPRGGRTSPSAIALPMRSFFCHSPDPPPRRKYHLCDRARRSSSATSTPARRWPTRSGRPSAHGGWTSSSPTDGR